MADLEARSAAEAEPLGPLEMTERGFGWHVNGDGIDMPMILAAAAKAMRALAPEQQRLLGRRALFTISLDGPGPLAHFQAERLPDEVS